MKLSETVFIKPCFYCGRVSHVVPVREAAVVTLAPAARCGSPLRVKPAKSGLMLARGHPCRAYFQQLILLRRLACCCSAGSAALTRQRKLCSERSLALRHKRTLNRFQAVFFEETLAFNYLLNHYFVALLQKCCSLIMLTPN